MMILLEIGHTATKYLIGEKDLIQSFFTASGLVLSDLSPVNANQQSILQQLQNLDLIHVGHILHPTQLDDQVPLPNLNSNSNLNSNLNSGDVSQQKHFLSFAESALEEVNAQQTQTFLNQFKKQFKSFRLSNQPSIVRVYIAASGGEKLVQQHIYLEKIFQEIALSHHGVKIIKQIISRQDFDNCHDLCRNFRGRSFIICPRNCNCNWFAGAGPEIQSSRR
jgi:hypothetical protein